MRINYGIFVLSLLILSINCVYGVTADQSNSTAVSVNLTDYPQNNREWLKITSNNSIINITANASHVTPVQTFNPSEQVTIIPELLLTLNIIDIPDGTAKLSLAPASNQTTVIKLDEEAKGTADKIGKAKLAAIEPFLRYKKSKTVVQRKFSDDLLQLIDSNYPKTGMSREQEKKIMRAKGELKSKNQLNFANKDKQMLKISQPGDDQVNVYIFLKPSASTQFIDAYATNITYRDQEKHFVTAWVDLNNLEKLALNDEIISIQTVIPPLLNTVTTEGDDLLRSNDVRNTYNLKGKGVKIGVISDGVVHISDSINAGELPNTVHIREIGVNDEGTAMLEIVHDIAPEAELYFHSGVGRVDNFNHAIDDLDALGCDIIVDNIKWKDEPYFEDGLVASHIKNILSGNPNLIYITSAGNNAENHYQGDYFEDGNHMHDFSRGSNKYLDVTIAPGEELQAFLQWNDKWGASSNDYDLYLYRQIGPFEYEILKSSTKDQEGIGNNPQEFFSFINSENSNIYAQIDINRPSSTTPEKTLELYIYPPKGSGYTNIAKDYLIASDSIYGHAAIPDVITVGANKWSWPSEIEPFSSQGPVTISYPTSVLRSKPDIIGFDYVITSVRGFEDFGGTSAAAPHIAGIVALAKQANPSLSRSQIQNYLYGSAIDLGLPGRDNIYGFGRADALKMIQTINPTTPTPMPTLTPTPTPTVTPTPTSPPSAPVADFTAIPVSGTAPIAVQFIDRSTNSPKSWSWDFGDGQRQIGNQYQPVHLYSNAGTYTVSLTASNSAGSDTKTRSNLITISPPPANERVQNGDCNSVLYWTTNGDSGSGGTWYPARYVPYEGQSGGYIQSDVNGALSGWANSAIYQDTDLTNVNKLTYYLMTISSSSAGDKRIEVYIDNMRIKTITSPSGLTSWTQYSQDVSGYSGIHRIKFYTSTSNSGSGGWLKVGVDTVSAIAEINPPVASFTESQNSGTVPFSVIFSDTSTNTPTTWAWDFGDDGTSTVQNPAHTYTSTGTYTVKLTAANIVGSNTQIKTGYIIASNIPASTPTPTPAPTVTPTSTPIVTPLPTENTAALLHFNGADQSTSFVDETGKTWSGYGDAKLSASKNKFGTASGSFDGSGDYIASPSSSDFSFGTGDWTVDCWVNFNSVSSINTIVSSPSSGGDNKFVIWQDGYSNQITAYVGGTSTAAYWIPQTNRWYHIEVSRESTTVRIFIDGAQVASATRSANLDFSQVYIGKYGGSSSYMMNGYIDEVRISKGIARHNSNFSPASDEYGSSTPTPTPTPTPTMTLTPTPTVTETSTPTPTETPAPIDSYIKALLHFNGADQSTSFIDETGKTWNMYGDAKLRTSQVKFGSASGSFDGSGDYLVSLSSSDFSFGTGDWTFDCWVNFNSVSSINTIVSSPSSGSDNKFVIWQDGYSNQITAYVGGTSTAASWIPQTNRWYHIEVSRQGSVVRIFIDGVQVTSATRSANLDFSQMYVGKYGSSNSYMMNGYIDELRISKGIARHSSKFNPQVLEYR